MFQNGVIPQIETGESNPLMKMMKAKDIVAQPQGSKLTPPKPLYEIGILSDSSLDIANTRSTVKEKVTDNIAASDIAPSKKEAAIQQLGSIDDLPNEMLLDFGTSLMQCDSPYFSDCLANATTNVRKGKAAREAAALDKEKHKLNMELIRSQTKAEKAKADKYRMEALGANVSKSAWNDSLKGWTRQVGDQLLVKRPGDPDWRPSDSVEPIDETEYKERIVPVGDGMMQKQQSLAGGKEGTWVNFGKPYVQSKQTINVGQKTEYDRFTDLKADYTSDTKDDTVLLRDLDNAINFLSSAVPNAYDIRAAQNAFSSLADPGTMSYKEVTDARVLGPLGKRIADHINTFLSGNITPASQRELLEHFQNREAVVNDRVELIRGQYRLARDKYAPEVADELLFGIQKGKAEKAYTPEDQTLMNQFNYSKEQIDLRNKLLMGE